MSSSRQFVVYGTDNRLRAALCDIAERNKRDVLRLLGARDQWNTPIVIQAQYLPADRPGAPLAQLHVSQTGAGLKFQIEFCLRPEISSPEIDRELLRAIFLELMYRRQPGLPAGTPYVEAPDWLVEGTLALASEDSSAFMARTLGTAVGTRALTLEEFLHQKRSLLDSPSQALYRAYSAALLSMLVERPEGHVRIARFVGDMAVSPSDPLADLKSHFPEVGENTGETEKTWQFHLARLAARESYRMLSCAESERDLAELLRVNLRTGNRMTTYTLEEFSQFMPDPSAASELKRCATQLLLLSASVNPLYRPIIGEYQEIAALLLRRKSKKIPRRLAELRATREHLSRQMNEIGDYMNWFEATQAGRSSGAFREYLRAAKLALEPEPRRRDPISVYLDALEAQF